jgi:pimeloyl-ACP methyl ester carboxylesterase
MTTFALVHGAFHGAWCFGRLIPELQARGHDAAAVDLPIEDVGASWSDYAASVLNGLQGARGPVVLVGHSLGGLTIPVVAARTRIQHMVFLCAAIPVPRLAVAEQEDLGVPMTWGDARTVRDDLGRRLPTPESARSAF